MSCLAASESKFIWSLSFPILSKICKGRLGGKGLGLLEQKPDTKDFRIKTLHLTKRGQSVRNDLLALLG